MVALVSLAGAPAGAQEYPSKPIRMIVPYAPGGGADIVARLVSQQLSESLRQPVIVDNRGGAGGNIGTDAIAKAAPDGYTIGIASPGPITMGKAMYPKLPYDPAKDLAPIIYLYDSPVVLVTYESMPARSVKDLVELGKSRPKGFTAALSSTGSVQHLLTEMLKRATGMTIENIPYKGGAPAVNDVVGGQVDMAWSVVPIVLPFVQSGKLRILAVASEKRSALLPAVPTMAEAGWPSVTGGNWNGLVAPAGVPKDVITLLNAHSTKALTSPEVRKRFAALGLEAIGGTPEEFSRFMEKETAKWADVIRSANIKAD
jgi:tripartite-type tricarboxylate transporter receptor subunit TctC